MAIVQLRDLRLQHTCHQSHQAREFAQLCVHVPTTGELQSLQHRVRPACVSLVLF